MASRTDKPTARNGNTKSNKADTAKTDGRKNRGPRAFTSAERAEFMAAKGADTEATGNQKTNYELLKEIWSGRGEIVTMTKGIPVAVARSDLIRQLQELPREGKAVLKLVPGDQLGVPGVRVLAWTSRSTRQKGSRVDPFLHALMESMVPRNQ